VQRRKTAQDGDTVSDGPEYNTDWSCWLQTSRCEQTTTPGDTQDSQAPTLNTGAALTLLQAYMALVHGKIYLLPLSA
jgi:hypothetical protein